MSALAVVALFGAGLLSFASPCVLPLVPAWVAIAAGDVDDPQALRWGTAWFVGGFTLVFVMLGTLAGRIGGIVDPAQTWIVRIGGLLLVGFGLAILPYLLLQAAVGIMLLEIVNYLEHYGMLRRKEHTGRWERVRPSHSWNSNNLATNVLLYHLQRHSDHHANPTRRYQALRDFEEAPVLPTGYAGMILLALIPPLWFRIMDPRVLAHFDGDMSRANIAPRRRDRVLARYPVPSSA